MSKCLPLQMLYHIDDIRMFSSSLTYHNVMEFLMKICDLPIFEGKILVRIFCGINSCEIITSSSELNRIDELE